MSTKAEVLTPYAIDEMFVFLENQVSQAPRVQT